MKRELRNTPGFQEYLTPAVLLALILLLGAALRFYDLGAESYIVDEMSTVIKSQQSIPQMITSGRLDQPPAYYVPFHFWVELFGTNEVSTRSFSALAGIGSIALVYLIGCELFAKPVGLLSAFLMAVTEFQISYSQEAQFYSSFELVTLFSFFFLILALRTRKIIHYFFYVLASIIMVYVHTYGIFILIAQNLFFFIQAIKRKTAISTWLTCQALIALFLLPYLLPLLFGASGIRGAIDFNIGGLSTPSILDPFRSIYLFVMPSRRDRSWETMFVNFAAAGALLVAGIWGCAIRRGKSAFLTAAKGWVASMQEVPDVKSKVLLVSCWLLSPIVLPFVASQIVVPMYSDRYTISAAPALYLLLSFGALSIRKAVPLIVSIGVFAVMIAPSLGYYYVTDTHEEWREVAAYVEENSGKGDVIVFAPNMGIGIQQRTFYWYYRGTLQGCGLSKQLSDSEVWNGLMQCVSGHQHFWVIIRGTSDDLPLIRYKSFFLNPNQTVMHLIRERQFVELSVYYFEVTKR